MSARGLIVAAVLPVAACSHAAKVVKAETPQAPEPAAVAALQAPVAPSVKACSSDDQCTASDCASRRGTVQYNIALGFRRAHVVAKYVEDLGVPPARMSEVSYGKEQPICTEATESCWAMNRRADLAPGARAKEVAVRIQADERRERTAAASSDVTQGRNAPAAHRTSHVCRSSGRTSSPRFTNRPRNRDWPLRGAWIGFSRRPTRSRSWTRVPWTDDATRRAPCSGASASSNAA